MCDIWFSTCFQAEMKIRVLEAKHQEEKLTMQQRHDADVEKVRIKTEVVSTLTAAATLLWMAQS